VASLGGSFHYLADFKGPEALNSRHPRLSGGHEMRRTKERPPVALQRAKGHDMAVVRQNVKMQESSNGLESSGRSTT
jgi:hypothetical protein